MPTVLTHDEAKNIINSLHDKHWLIASLLYGCGLRINEALQLKVKGRKGRYTLLPPC